MHVLPLFNHYHKTTHTYTSSFIIVFTLRLRLEVHKGKELNGMEWNGMIIRKWNAFK